jgi:hypothetical protein
MKIMPTLPKTRIYGSATSHIHGMRTWASLSFVQTDDMETSIPSVMYALAIFGVL